MRKEKGITLIALVVTIIVLITLASVSIGALTGDNGIINQSKQAKEETEIAEEKEAVEISAVQAAGMDRYGYVTEENFRNQLNNNIGNGKYELDVIGEKFKVTYTESQRSYYVDKNGNIEIADGSNNDGIYSEPGAEEQIAPTDLFNFEIIDVSAKTAKILGIKSQYCNVGGFNTETKKEDLPDTNYRIKYSGITDTLVIPYQVEIDGEIYTITEVDLSIQQIDEFGTTIGKYSNFPNIETIIYPNTVTKIYSAYSAEYINGCPLKKVILSENLTEIPERFFMYANNLIDIAIPDSVTCIGYNAFDDTGWYNNQPNGEVYAGKVFYEYKGNIPEGTSITIKEGTKSISSNAFEWESGLTSITIPDSVTSIGSWAFAYCDGLTSITIPDTVINVESYAFGGWTSTQIINVPFKEGKTPSGWDEYWNYGCAATINYLK